MNAAGRTEVIEGPITVIIWAEFIHARLLFHALTPARSAVLTIAPLPTLRVFPLPSLSTRCVCGTGLRSATSPSLPPHVGGAMQRYRTPSLPCSRLFRLQRFSDGLYERVQRGGSLAREHPVGGCDSPEFLTRVPCDVEYCNQLRLRCRHQQRAHVRCDGNETGAVAFSTGDVALVTSTDVPTVSATTVASLAERSLAVRQRQLGGKGGPVHANASRITSMSVGLKTLA